MDTCNCYSLDIYSLLYFICKYYIRSVALETYCTLFFLSSFFKIEILTLYTKVKLHSALLLKQVNSINLRLKS